MKPIAEFDSCACTYEADLNQALSVSGEDKDYFARGRVVWLAKCLRSMGEEPRSAVDYGCGIGGTGIFLRKILGVQSVLGLDISARSLEIARSRYGSDWNQFRSFEEYSPNGEIDLVYCNGVFHHIPVLQRIDVVNYIVRSLRPGGLFALWENNPWNPGTRYVMSRCAFDRDAVTLTPPETTGLLRAAGFQVLRVDFLFIFPRPLKFLRFFEPWLSGLPLGAQYVVLSRKRAS
jgi:SAM-dependent methyltransferase